MMKSQRAFTLVEFVFVILILSVLSAFSTIAINAGYSSYLNANQLLTAEAQGRQALEIMMRDMHQLRSSADIVSMSTSALSFVATNGQTISYTLNAGLLMRQIGVGTSQILGQGIVSLGFTYYDINNVVTTIAANTRYINVNLGLTQSNASFHMSAGIFTRDLI